MHSRKRKFTTGDEQPATSIDALPTDLLLEILVRLPGKEIGCCKCVCKPWRSTIRSQPFRKIYRIRNSGLLLYWPENIRRPGESAPKRRLRFFHHLLGAPGELMSPLSEMNVVLENAPQRRHYRIVHSESWVTRNRHFEEDLLASEGPGVSRVTEIINGLLCAFQRDETSGPNFKLVIHNICTGEKMKIPDPLTFAADDNPLSTYHLGFDSASRSYKLLRLIFGNCFSPRPLLGAHIMTLRPRSGPPPTWRELNGLPSVSEYGLLQARTCSDGSFLCWIRFEQTSLALLYFDMNEERFRLVELPRDPSKDNYIDHIDNVHIATRFEDRIALWVTRHVDGKDVLCYAQDEGENWRISKEFKSSRGSAFAAGIFPDSSLKGELLGMNLDDPRRRILCYSRKEDEDAFLVGKLPDDDDRINPSKFDTCGCPDAWLSCFFHFKCNLIKLCCLTDGNNLYLPLDDVFGGGSV